MKKTSLAKRIFLLTLLGLLLVGIILFVVWKNLPITLLVSDEVTEVLQGGAPSSIKLFWDSLACGNHLVYISGDNIAVQEILQQLQPKKAIFSFTKIQTIGTLKELCKDTKFWTITYSLPSYAENADLVIYPDIEKIHAAFVEKAGNKKDSLVIFDAVRSDSSFTQVDTQVSESLDNTSTETENTERKTAITIEENASFLTNEARENENLYICVISGIKTDLWPKTVKWLCDVSFYNMAVQSLQKNIPEDLCFFSFLPKIYRIFF